MKNRFFDLQLFTDSGGGGTGVAADAYYETAFKKG